MKRKLVMWAVILAMFASFSVAMAYTPFRKFVATGISGDTLAAGDTLWSNVVYVGGYHKMAVFCGYKAFTGGDDSLQANVFFGNSSNWNSTYAWAPMDANEDGAMDHLDLGCVDANNTAINAVLYGDYVGRYIRMAEEELMGNYVRLRLININPSDSCFLLTVQLIVWDHPVTSVR